MGRVTQLWSAKWVKGDWYKTGWIHERDAEMVDILVRYTNQIIHKGTDFEERLRSSVDKFAAQMCSRQ